jgi:hypothetical protein
MLLARAAARAKRSSISMKFNLKTRRRANCASRTQSGAGLKWALRLGRGEQGQE